MDGIRARTLFTPGGAYGVATLAGTLYADTGGDGGRRRVVRARLDDGAPVAEFSFDGEEVLGLTTHGEQLVVLTEEREVVAGASPDRLKQSLHWRDPDGGLRTTVPLQSRHWKLVTEPPRADGGLLVLYDATPSGCVRAFGPDGEEVWRREFPDVTRVLRGARDRLLVHADGGATVVEIRESDGETAWRLPRVGPAGVHWSASADAGDDVVLAGAVDHFQSLVARVRRGTEDFETVCEIDLRRHVSEELLRARVDDERCCGYDMNLVPCVRALSDGAFLVVIGGPGDRDAACQGWCAATVVRPGAGAVRLVELDSDGGATDVLALSDRRVLVNCWGVLHEAIVEVGGP